MTLHRPGKTNEGVWGMLAMGLHGEDNTPWRLFCELVNADSRAERNRERGDYDYASSQREEVCCGCSCRHITTLGNTGPFEADRYQVWVRHWGMRFLYRPH